MQSFRNQLNIYAAHNSPNKHCLLTSAISPNNGGDWQAQDILLSSTRADGATQFVDFFNVMAYDYTGSWNTALIRRYVHGASQLY